MAKSMRYIGKCLGAPGEGEYPHRSGPLRPFFPPPFLQPQRIPAFTSRFSEYPRLDPFFPYIQRSKSIAIDAWPDAWLILEPKTHINTMFWAKIGPK